MGINLLVVGEVEHLEVLHLRQPRHFRQRVARQLQVDQVRHPRKSTPLDHRNLVLKLKVGESLG